MKREYARLKKKILSRMDVKEYNEIIRVMADDVYNSTDYDVIIPVARKCSSLYMALLPLVKEEWDGSIEETHEQHMLAGNAKETVVLTDRALDWVIWNIKRNAKNETVGKKIRHILLLDDIIIHGRTLSRIRQTLVEAFQEAGIAEHEYVIKIATFAVNRRGLLIDTSKIANTKNVREYRSSDWRPFSGKIVDMIYLMGQTYTSYVPKLIFPMNSDSGKKIKEFLSRNDRISEITDPARKDLGVRVYACVAEPEAAYALCESYRIFEFTNQQEYAFVPMVSMRAVNEECLNAYIDALFRCRILEQRKRQEAGDEIRTFLDQCSGEYRYRLALYAISAFAGWKFLQESIGITNQAEYNRYDQEVENYNFYFVGIKSFEELCGQNTALPDLSSEFAAQYDRIMTPEVIQKALDMIARDEFMKQLTDSVEDILKREREKSKEAGRQIKGDVIGKLFTINHEIDEALYRKADRTDKRGIWDRVRGIPLSDIIAILVREGSRSLQEVFTALLEITDYGKASIVTRCFEESKTERYYISLVHAGEENYQYYITHYLPVLYGLCMLEFRRHDMSNPTEKEKYLDRFYQDNPPSEYLDLDRENLLSSETLTELRDIVYEAPLFRSMDESTKEALYNAIKLAKDFIEGQQDGLNK